MNWTSIHHAHEYWKSRRQMRESSAVLDDAEAFILNAPPHTVQDAACILEVVCAYGGDGRCDSLDLTALKRVQRFLAAA